jgi:hypothetical protein
MPDHRAATFPVLLQTAADHAGHEDRGRDRPDIHETAVLREQAHPRGDEALGLCHWPGPDTALHALDGLPGNLSQEEPESAKQGAQGISLSFARGESGSREPGLGNRYYLYPDVSWFCLSGGNLGLVQPLCAFLAADQGCQFTSRDFTEKLLAKSIRISMDGRGRAFDNIFVERLWRTVKYEEVYIKSYENVNECRSSLRTYFEFYNQERFHQALGYATPAEIYYGRVALKVV